MLKVDEALSLAALLQMKGAKFSEAVRVCTFIVLWGRWMDANGGRSPGIERFIAKCGVNHATAYRWQSSFRKFFGDEITPADVWRHVRGQLDGKTLAADPEWAATQFMQVLVQVDELKRAA